MTSNQESNYFQLQGKVLCLILAARQSNKFTSTIIISEKHLDNKLAYVEKIENGRIIETEEMNFGIFKTGLPAREWLTQKGIPLWFWFLPCILIPEDISIVTFCSVHIEFSG